MGGIKRLGPERRVNGALLCDMWLLLVNAVFVLLVEFGGAVPGRKGAALVDHGRAVGRLWSDCIEGLHRLGVQVAPIHTHIAVGDILAVVSGTRSLDAGVKVGRLKLGLCVEKINVAFLADVGSDRSGEFAAGNRALCSV